MVKGTPSFGTHNKITHIRCRRCGRHAYHIRKKKCSACGFGVSKKIRNYAWKNKTTNRQKRKPRVSLQKKAVSWRKPRKQ